VRPSVRFTRRNYTAEGEPNAGWTIIEARLLAPDAPEAEQLTPKCARMRTSTVATVTDSSHSQYYFHIDTNRSRLQKFNESHFQQCSVTTDMCSIKSRTHAMEQPRKKNLHATVRILFFLTHAPRTRRWQLKQIPLPAPPYISCECRSPPRCCRSCGKECRILRQFPVRCVARPSGSHS